MSASNLPVASLLSQWCRRPRPHPSLASSPNIPPLPTQLQPPWLPSCWLPPQGLCTCCLLCLNILQHCRVLSLSSSGLTYPNVTFPVRSFLTTPLKMTAPHHPILPFLFSRALSARVTPFISFSKLESFLQGREFVCFPSPRTRHSRCSPNAKGVKD